MAQEQTKRQVVQDKKTQLSNLLSSAFLKIPNQNFSVISKDNSTGELVFEVALRMEALEEGGAPSEFKGVANNRKAAEQQAAQAALSELQPRLEMLAATRRAAPKQKRESAKSPKQVAGAKVELTAEVKAAVQAAAEAAVKAAAEATAKLAATTATTELATAPTQNDRKEIADKVADFAREIIAQLDAEGKSVELELSGWRLKFLLPTLAKLPQRLQASAQLRPAERIASDAQQYVLHVTRDAPMLSSGAHATTFSGPINSRKLAESLRAQFDGMTRGELEQGSGTINIVFRGTGESLKVIKALAILQSTFSQEERSVKFAPRYTLTEDKGIVVPGITVALTVA